MKTILDSMALRTLVLLFAASAAIAQALAEDRSPFRQEELDQMLAPVALYPDSLLSQILMASTYPLEIVQAARWSRANPGLRGENAVNAAARMDWDPSVKSLTAFPQVLSMMDEKLEWTERLGEAFLAQQADVMNTVQGLRRRADAAGNLRSHEQVRVARQGEAIVIEPPAPGIVYVPYYSPVVFGPWWWPAYPPVYWSPPPAYYVVPAHRPVFLWSSGIVVPVGFFFGRFDWPHRHVKVVHAHSLHHAGRPAHVHSHWRHDPLHRRGAPFRHVDARRHAGWSDAARVDRSAGDSRTADVRQRRWEDRRDGLRGRHEEWREPAGNRATPENGGHHANRGQANRNGERAQSLARPETRGAQADRGVRPERHAPRADAGRQERGDNTPRGQSSSHQQQARIATPVVRAEPRPAASVAARTPAPRPAADPTRAPRMENHRQRNNLGAPPQGSGNQRGERSTNRDGNRRS